MIRLIKLINSSACEWRIAMVCGLLVVAFIVLLSTNIQLCQTSVTGTDQLNTEQSALRQLVDPGANTKVLKKKIEQKQAKLTDLEIRLQKMEGMTRQGEDELSALYRQISDLKGEIASDQFKLRLRGETCVPTR